MENLLATLWVIWRERYSICFDGKSSSMESLLDHIRFETATWVSTGPHFRGTPTDMIVLLGFLLWPFPWLMTSLFFLF